MVMSRSNCDMNGRRLVVPHSDYVERRAKRSGTQAKTNALFRAISEHPSVAYEARGNYNRQGAYFDDDGPQAASSTARPGGTNGQTKKKQGPVAANLLRQANFSEPLTVSSARIAGHARMRKFTSELWMDFIISALDYYHIDFYFKK